MSCCGGREGKEGLEEHKEESEPIKHKDLQEVLNEIGAPCRIDFEEPGLPIAVGGGSSNFWALKVRGKPRDKEDENSVFWLGKDLTRAVPELEFYHKANGLKGKPGWEILDFLFDYAGVKRDFNCRIDDDEDLDIVCRDLLVLQDVTGPVIEPRLMDIKIGGRTASGGWKGKSRLEALKQKLLDMNTSTVKEGLRVEGFLGPPSWVDSEDPLEDFDGWIGSDSTRKKARRFMLQRMSAKQALDAFADFNCQQDHQGLADDEEEVHVIIVLLGLQFADLKEHDDPVINSLKGAVSQWAGVEVSEVDATPYQVPRNNAVEVLVEFAVNTSSDFSVREILEQDIEGNTDNPVTRLLSECIRESTGTTYGVEAKPAKDTRPFRKEAVMDELFIQPGEYGEMIMMSIMKQLGKMLKACRDIPVPQKWIGSSIALLADSGVLVERETWAAAMKNEKQTGIASSGPHTAGVYIFDWGRSELTTEEDAEAHGAADRTEYWNSYQFGIQTLFSSACFMYWLHFTVTEWEKIRIVVYDYDSSNDCDLLGRREIALEMPKSGSKSLFHDYDLRDLWDNMVAGLDHKYSTVNVCIWYMKYPEPSRLEGVWRVELKHARHLTIADIHSGLLSETFDADPFATVTAVESEASAARVGLTGGRRRFYKQRTDVNANCLDPLWAAVFEFPVVKQNPTEDDGGLQALQKVLKTWPAKEGEVSKERSTSGVELMNSGDDKKKKKTDKKNKENEGPENEREELDAGNDVDKDGSGEKDEFEIDPELDITMQDFRDVFSQMDEDWVVV